MKVAGRSRLRKQKINLQFSKNVMVRCLHALALKLSYDEQSALITAIEASDLCAAFDICKKIPNADALFYEAGQEEMRRTVEFFKKPE